MKNFKFLFIFPFLLQFNFLSGTWHNIRIGGYSFGLHREEIENPQKRLESNYPYIAGDVFRNFCDFIFDGINTHFDVKKVKDGDTIFVKDQNDFLDYFFKKFHPNIKAKYILITHNGLSDVHRYEKYLANENLVAWFGKNMTIVHPKVEPIPLGIANGHWVSGNKECINNVIENLPKKDKLLCLNFGKRRGNVWEARNRLFDQFKNKNFCYCPGYKKFKEYLIDAARSKFVLSPKGMGIDCLRTWEALLMGSFPIVTTSKLDRLFKGLPVVIINDWEEVTEAFLNRKYEEMCQQHYNMERLYADYWLDKIRALQEKVRTETPLQ